MIPAGDDAEQESDADVAARRFAAGRWPRGRLGVPPPACGGEQRRAMCAAGVHDFADPPVGAGLDPV
jgi:hypothetical protein